MPNTLVHIAVQAPISRKLFQGIEIPWILLGVIIPDIPWIVQRILLSVQIIPPYQVKLYCTVQASLAFSLLICLALSNFSRKPWVLFALLSFSSFFHLILDSLQIKWGNGVHLMAPFSWHLTDNGRIWPEHPIGYVLSVFAIGYMIINFTKMKKEGLRLYRPIAVKNVFFPVLLYIFLPFFFTNQLEQSNSGYIQTLMNTSKRSNKEIALDRVSFSAANNSVTLFSGESVLVTGNIPQHSGIISLQGVFTAPGLIDCKRFHIHNGYRNYASYLGLALTVLLWSYLLIITRENYLKERKRK